MSVKTNGAEKATLSNHLGLDNGAMEKLSKSLNKLLSDYHVFYQNLRGFHSVSYTHLTLPTNREV